MSKWQKRLVIYDGLHHKEQVLLMAKRLGVTPNAVVGGLIQVWLKAQEIATGAGLLEHKTAMWLDVVVGIDGFTGAMAEVGWIAVGPDGLTVTKYDRHIAKTAVRKVDDVVRKHRGKSAPPAQPNPSPELLRNCSGTAPEKLPDVTPVPVVSPPVKKKSKSKRPTKAEIGDPPPSPLFEQFWAAYPEWKRVERFNCSWAFYHLGVTPELLARMLESLEAWKRCDLWRKDNGQFVCNPLTWLNGRRWQDQPGVARGDNGGVRGGARVVAEPGKYDRPKRLIVADAGAEVLPRPAADGGGQPSLFAD